jgi:DNA-binding response OmpR family regulator
MTWEHFMIPNPARKVLLVDDDPVYLDRLKEALRQCGFAISSANDGASGLLAAHSEQPDLIVVDAEMPVMNGYQMLEVLRNDPTSRNPWIILLTPQEEESEIARGWLYGADVCLPRGAGFGDLVLMIERALSPGAEALSLAS